MRSAGKDDLRHVTLRCRNLPATTGQGLGAVLPGGAHNICGFEARRPHLLPGGSAVSSVRQGWLCLIVAVFRVAAEMFRCASAPTNRSLRFFQSN